MNIQVQSAAAHSTPKAETGAQPQKLWQWILLYPSLAIALLGSVPTWTEALRSHAYGVPFGNSTDAVEQNTLFQKNFDCLHNAEFSTLVNPSNVEISTTICKSGDVLLRGRRPEQGAALVRWVSWDKMVANLVPSRVSMNFDLIGSAQAAELPHTMLAQAPPPRILCQRWVAAGQLLQRVQQGAMCLDQVVNTYNGSILSSKPAACTAQC